MWYSFNFGAVHYVSLNTETDFPGAGEEHTGDSGFKNLPAGGFGYKGALQLGRRLPDQGRVVDESVLGSGALCLQGAEQGLLGAEDLYGGGRLFGQVEQ